MLCKLCEDQYLCPIHDAPYIPWEIEDGVRCVVCPGCAFTFDACHTDDGTGRYSCPDCGFGTVT